MAWVRCCGGNKSLGKHIYDNGAINYSLCGGLSRSGYTQSTGWTNDGTITFQSTDIYLTASADLHTATFGSINAIDVTNYSALTIIWTDTTNVERTSIIDITGVSGNAYFFANFYRGDLNDGAMFGLCSSKANCWVNKLASYASEALSHGSITISEIFFI